MTKKDWKRLDELFAIYDTQIPLAEQAVDNAKIANLAVDTAQLAANAVENAKIAVLKTKEE